MLKIFTFAFLLLISLTFTKSVTANRLLGEVDLIDSYAINEDLFVQGFELDQEDQLLIGTGLYGESAWGYFDWEKGILNRSIELEKKYFGEGITLRKRNLWQLTWKEGKVFQWDIETKELLNTYEIESEGWGLAYNNEKDIFYLSDGSSTIYKYDPDNFELIDQVDVTLKGELVDQLNELEYANDAIYANIWYDNRIVKINPDSGKVLQVYDLTTIIDQLDLTAKQRETMDVLNGIAHIEKDLFYLTGKNYPLIFKVKLK
ncbi:glutaminyl-peptide cyclotransferase [Facklamia sp. 7083-14-GEN3]|uniref:glutaminyl-peptide cyclotransferase n=1 Tax=Facklamia sp. 7083-14-GEN3 TaxID=2973478 RepID=UPI00215CF6BA|nr:glutaminyl-peptide cyclotransferase [Facklamia sp. 7083-14-GEN3]MCR8968720.1 glutaminyl-peptide cyclotransferase [Facklamia sp. 7083-14-GEN3]